MHGRPIDGLAVAAHCQVIRDRDGFAMRDEEAVIGPLERRPAAHPHRGARTQEVDRRTAAEFMARPIGREMPLMRAPAELAWLAAFAAEAADRPGVDELADTLGDIRDLRVALGDMDDLDAEPMRERRPAVAIGGNLLRRGARL